MSKIFFVLGKSCSGKDTIFQSLKENKQLNLKTVVGYTTRPMRVNEKDGVEYFFVDQNKLEELKKAKKVIECRDYNTVHGIWSYFTVDDGQIDLNNGDYLYIGTLESYEQMIDFYGEDVVVPLYIQVETGERLARAVNRERNQSEPKYKELCRRFLADEEDFSEEKIEKAGIRKRFENNNLNQCIKEIEQEIVKKIKEGGFLHYLFFNIIMPHLEYGLYTFILLLTQLFLYYGPVIKKK